MDNYGIELVSALSRILPTYYELALTSGTETPCISWQERNNYTITEVLGATVGYSRVAYTIKVWGKDLADLNKYAIEINKALVPLGYKRTSCQELHDYNSTMIQKIMTFEALALEEF